MTRAALSEDNAYFPVVIIGGGLAGLTAGAYLAEAGLPSLILESNDSWPGGRLCGGEPDELRDGDTVWRFPTDHGMHAIWGSYVNLKATIERFSDIQLLSSEGEDWINRWGNRVRVVEAGSPIRNSWFPAPFHYLQLLLRPGFWRALSPWDVLSIPGLLFSMAWATGYDPIGERSRLPGLAMNDFFIGWTPNLRATFTGLGVNLLAAPRESISLSSFIAAMRFYTILRRDAWHMDYFPQPPALSYLPHLIQRVEATGGRLSAGTTAIQLERAGDGWRLTVEDSLRRGLRSLYAEQIVLAVNPSSAERLLNNSPDTYPPAETLPIRFPRTIRNAVVRLWFRTTPASGAPAGMLTGNFHADNFFWLHRFYDEFRAWHEQTGGSVIEMHFYGSEALLDTDDRHLLILAVTDAQLAFDEVRGHFVHGVVRRNSRTHTVFDVPDSASLGVNTPWPNVFACGDWVAHPTPSFWMERATITGMAAANAILAARSLPGVNILPPPSPEVSARLLGALVKAIRLAFAPIVFGLRRAFSSERGHRAVPNHEKER